MEEKGGLCMKRYLWVPLIGLLAILAGCSSNAESDAGSIKEYVAELSAGNIAESASIDSESLMVTEDGGEIGRASCRERRWGAGGAARASEQYEVCVKERGS